MTAYKENLNLTYSYSFVTECEVLEIPTMYFSKTAPWLKKKNTANQICILDAIYNVTFFSDHLIYDKKIK